LHRKAAEGDKPQDEDTQRLKRKGKERSTALRRQLDRGKSAEKKGKGSPFRKKWETAPKKKEGISRMRRVLKGRSRGEGSKRRQSPGIRSCINAAERREKRKQKLTSEVLIATP